MDWSEAVETADEAAIGFLAQVVRLEREIRDVGQHLERLELELQGAVNNLERRRFEEYR